MPAYNTGTIIHQTMNSLLNQSFEDFELIIVDDGSSDNTPQILDEYLANDKRISVFHRENSGICNSRNFGIEKCTGDYILFCDHDDLYEVNLLEVVYNTLKDQNNVDIVKYRKVTHVLNSSNETIKSIHNTFSTEAIDFKTSKEGFWTMLESNSLSTVWDGIYRTDFIKQNKILFDPFFKAGGEDYVFMYHALSNFPKVIFVDKLLYTHFVWKNFSTSAKYSSYKLKQLPVLIDEHIKCLSRLGWPTLDEQHQTISSVFLFRQSFLPMIELLCNEKCDKSSREKSELLSALYANYKKSVFEISSKEVLRISPKCFVLFGLFKRRMFSQVLNVYRLLKSIQKIQMAIRKVQQKS